MFSLIDMLGANAPMIDIVDVGAMWLGEEDLAYGPLVKKGAARVVGFEPVQSECDLLNSMKRPLHTYLPYFIGDGREATFHICNESMTSSIYEPNLPLLSKFNGLVELTTPVKAIPCKTRRLDDIPEITAIDFLKVDVQGAELDVLVGGKRLLGNAVLIQTEVEFVEMYKGQPLFADVDAELRRQGFVLHTLHPPMSRAFKPMMVNGDPYRGVNQALWADAYYVKDFMRFVELAPLQLLKLAVLLHELFKSCDLAALAIQHFDAKTGEDLWTSYMTQLGGANFPAKPPL